MSMTKKRLVRMIVLDVLLFGVLAFFVSARVFGLFGLFPSPGDDVPTTTLATPPPTQAPTQAPTPVVSDVTDDPAAVTDAPTAEPTLTPDPVAGLCGSRFPGKFTTGEIISDETTYKSKNVDISVSRYEENGVIYQIADIYIQDIQCLQTGGIWMDGVDTSRTPAMAEAVGAMLAINGDYYNNAKYRGHGWFVRNGVELARFDFSTYTSDLCVLYYDGSREVIPILEIDTLDHEGILAKYPYQIWYFGPSLLTADGKARPEGTYNSTLMTYNPRSAIGYYEPGHYCFVVIEGARGSKSDSKGMMMVELADLFEQLGCKAAYNLDGGDSATMYYNGAKFGMDGRSTTDIVFIKDIEEGEA